MNPTKPNWTAGATVVVISVITIVLQLTQTRILSFMFWSHVVYLLVYIALLGYGTAGALGALLRRETLERPAMVWGNLAAFAVVNVASIWTIAQMAARNPSAFTLGSGSWNVGALVTSYALCALPYFFLGLALISLFARYRKDFNILYAVDLSGAAVGGLLFVALLVPMGAPKLVCSLSLLAAVTASAWALTETRAQARLAVGAVAGLIVIGLFVAATSADALFALRPLPSKIMGRAQRDGGPNFQILHTSWNPVGRLDIYPVQPQHAAVPGYTITYDGDAFTGFSATPQTWPTDADRQRFNSDSKTERYLEATPYLWHPAARVLVIGIGGGADLRVAQLEHASQVDGVEINHSTIAAMTGPFAGASGNIYLRPNTRIFAGDGRSFLMNTQERWDVIHMTGIDTFLAASNGSFVMAENYLYTVQAARSYFRHLTPNGVYTCVRWEFPGRPRESLRVFSNVLQALHEEGIADPRQHVVVSSFTGGQGILMMQRSPWTAAQLQVIRQRTADSGNDLLYAPGTAPASMTSAVYHLLADTFAEGQQGLFFDNYSYDVSPVYDDRPFFYQYYKLSRLLNAVRTGEIMQATQQHGYWPFVVLAAVFAQGLLLVALFIFLPLLLWRRAGLRVKGAAALGAYFAALGAGYIMIELALMQKFALLLGDPIWSIVVVLCSMLVFTGVGSFLSGRTGANVSRTLGRVLAGVLTTLLLIVIGLEPLVHVALGAPFAVRAVLATAVCALLCTGLGFFFPLGVRVVEELSPGFLPWAWGINGGFSVLGSVSTVALALWTGFSTVLGAAALVYAIGVLSLMRFSQRHSAAAVS